MKKLRLKNGTSLEQVEPSQTDNHAPVLEDRQAREVSTLAILAGVTTLYLVGMLIASLVYSVRQTTSISTASPGSAGVVTSTVLLCIFAGTLGSSVMALRSIIERIAHGWELSDATKLPEIEPKDKFVAKMVPGFVARPLLGAAVGYLIYLAVVGGFWIVISPSGEVEFRPLGLAFLALLGGLFAKTLLEKLKGVFDNIFGK